MVFLTIALNVFMPLKNVVTKFLVNSGMVFSTILFNVKVATKFSVNTCKVFLTILLNVFLPLVNVVTKFLENKYVSFAKEEIKKFTEFSFKFIVKVILPIADVVTDLHFTWKCFKNGDIKYGGLSGKIYSN